MPRNLAVTLLRDCRVRLTADAVTGKLDVRAAGNLPEPEDIECNGTDGVVESKDTVEEEIRAGQEEVGQ